MIPRSLVRYRAFHLQVSVFCISPSLQSLIWQHTVRSTATTLGSHKHQQLPRALNRGQECSAPGRSQLLLTKNQDELHREHMGNMVLYSGLFLLCKNKTNKQTRHQGCPICCMVVVTDVTSLDKFGAFITSAAQENSETIRISWKKISFIQKMLHI